jgi:hypothetical protein
MYFTSNKNNDTLLNIVWNPSEGIDLGFYNSFLQPYVIAFGLGWYIMKTSLNVSQSIEN